MKRHLLDSGREAEDGEEEAVHVKVLKHALDRVAVDAEGDAGHAQIQAAAHHVISSQRVGVRRGHLPRYSAWRHPHSQFKLCRGEQSGAASDVTPAYLTRGAPHRSRRSRGRLPRRSHPSPPLPRGKDCSPPSWPSPHAGAWPALSQRAPHSPPSSRSTTSCTEWSPRMCPGRCWASRCRQNQAGNQHHLFSKSLSGSQCVVSTW